MKTISLRQGSCNNLLQSAYIIHIQGSSNYSRVYFINRPPLLVCKVLHWFEEQLPEEDFVRVHRSHLVNRAFISNRPSINQLLLHNGKLVPISRQRKIVLE